MYIYIYIYIHLFGSLPPPFPSEAATSSLAHGARVGGASKTTKGTACDALQLYTHPQVPVTDIRQQTPLAGEHDHMIRNGQKRGEVERLTARGGGGLSQYNTIQYNIIYYITI